MAKRYVEEGVGLVGFVGAVALLAYKQDGANPAVQAAWMAAVIAVGTMVVSWICFVYKPQRWKHTEAKLRYVEDQIAILYGPLLGLLIVSQEAYKTSLRHLGLESVVKDLDEGKSFLEPYQFFDPELERDSKVVQMLKITETTFIKNNRKIGDLIQNNYALVGPTIKSRPECVHRVLEHISEFEVRFTRYQLTHEKDVKTGKLWPWCLVKHVENKLELLTLLQEKYRAELNGDSIPRSSRVRMQALELELARSFHDQLHECGVTYSPTLSALQLPPENKPSQSIQ